MEVTVPVPVFVAIVLLISVTMTIVAPLGLGFLAQVLFRPRAVPRWVYWLLAVLWAGLLWIMGYRLAVHESGGLAVQTPGGALVVSSVEPYEWTPVILGGFFCAALFFVCLVGLFRAGGAFARGLLMKREDQT